MTRRDFGLPLLAALLALLPGTSSAATGNPRFFLHLTAPIAKNTCAIRNNPPTCAGVVTKGQVGPGYFAYVVVSNSDPVAGLGNAMLGVDYDAAPGVGVDVFGWTNCATFEFPSTGWPDAGGGNLFSWDAPNCHHVSAGGTVMAIAGHFYLSAYSPDEIEVTPRPIDNALEVTGCDGVGQTLTPSVGNLGWARFTGTGAAEGHAPCDFRNSPCRVRGPQEVAGGQSGIEFTVDPQYISPSGHWIISGNGQISSSDNDSAIVQALGAGTFTISYRLGPGCVEGCQCDYPVNVIGQSGVPAAPPVRQPTSWSRIKSVFRDGR